MGRTEIVSGRERTLVSPSRLHAALRSRRAAEQLLCLALAQSAAWFWRLRLWRRAGIRLSRTAAPTAAALLFLAERQLVVPLCVEIRGTQEQHLLVGCQ